MNQPFPVTRIYSDENGDSHFEDISFPMIDSGSIGFLSQPMTATSVIFRTVAPSYDYDFHTAPQKQLVVLLNGGIEVETSLGDKRVFPSGAVLLLEDTVGKGHRSRNLQAETRTSLFIPLP